MATASYFQSSASALTLATIASGVRVGPDGNFRGSACPLARHLTLVPPISTTRAFIKADLVTLVFSTPSIPSRLRRGCRGAGLVCVRVRDGLPVHGHGVRPGAVRRRGFLALREP